jgi:phosphate transport system permease protein
LGNTDQNILEIKRPPDKVNGQEPGSLDGKQNGENIKASLRMAVRRWIDIAVGRFTFTATILTVLMLIAFAALLYWKAHPILQTHTLSDLIFSSVWAPSEGSFGFLNFILGTLWVTVLSMLIALPLSLLTALYLVEYAPRWIRNLMEPTIDLLAGIPSVVYGVWGVVVIVPFVAKISTYFPETFSTGYSVLAGGIVLALMIIPIMVSVMQEVLRTTPIGLREVSLSIGSTRWETTKYIVCRHASAGLVAASIMALSRAFGETMAVLMVVGNVPVAPKTVLDPAYPLPALIANNYGEMMSVEMYDAALMTAAVILLVLVVVSQIFAKLVIRRMSNGS